MKQSGFFERDKWTDKRQSSAKLVKGPSKPEMEGGHYITAVFSKFQIITSEYSEFILQ